MAKIKKKKKAARKKKVFQLAWAFEPFEEHDSFYTKNMFGGLAAYCHGKMVMVLMESPGESSYRNNHYDFDIWNGIMFPTNFEHQEKLQKKYPLLLQHPVLKKWLYLPAESDKFEEVTYKLANQILRNSSLLGIFPKID